MQPPSADRNGRPTALLYARLIDPGTGLDETGGVLIEGGKIAELGPSVTTGSIGDAQVIDCGGHVLAPGLIDMLVVLTATALFGMIFMMIAWAEPPLWGGSPASISKRTEASE